MRHALVDMELYYYAMSCALSVLIDNAGRRGRGWYHFTDDGALIVATEVVL